MPVWARCLAAAGLLCAAALFFFERAFSPLLREFAYTQAKLLAVTTINRAVDEEMAAHPVSYEQLVHITRGGDGAVTSLELDPAAMNDASSRLTLASNAALSQLELQKVRIPIGTVLGWQLLAGRGPGVTFYIQPASYVESSFVSTFEAAGINQTEHRVVLRLFVEVETFVGGFHVRQPVESDVVLAQTVIVGAVPDFYSDSS